MDATCRRLASQAAARILSHRIGREHATPTSKAIDSVKLLLGDADDGVRINGYKIIQSLCHDAKSGLRVLVEEDLCQILIAKALPESTSLDVQVSILMQSASI